MECVNRLFDMDSVVENNCGHFVAQLLRHRQKMERCVRGLWVFHRGSPDSVLSTGSNETSNRSSSSSNSNSSSNMNTDEKANNSSWQCSLLCSRSLLS